MPMIPGLLIESHARESPPEGGWLTSSTAGYSYSQCHLVASVMELENLIGRRHMFLVCS